MEQNKKWTFIRKLSKQKITPAFDKIEYIKDGVYQVWLKGKVGLYDTVGNMLLPLVYQPINTIVEFGDKMYPLKDSIGKIQFYDNKGKVMFAWNFPKPPIPYVYFINGFLHIENGFITKKGKLTVPWKEHALNFEKNGLCPVGKKRPYNQMNWGVINKVGKVVVPLKYRSVKIEENHFILEKYLGDVFKEGPKLAIDLKGKQILNRSYKELQYFPKSGLYAYLKEEGKNIFSLINIKTKSEVSNKYTQFNELANGNLLLKNDSTFFIMDKRTYQTKHLGKFWRMGEMEGNPDIIWFEDYADRQGLMDMNGKTLVCLPVGYSINKSTKNWIIMSDKNGNVQVVDYNVLSLFPESYKYILYIKDLDVFQCRINGQLSFVDNNGDVFN